MVPNKWRWH